MFLLRCLSSRQSIHEVRQQFSLFPPEAHMRTPIYVLIAALFFSGCTHYHVTPAGTPVQPVDRVIAPEPEQIEPLELDVGRPVGAQLLIQTNRPAYVAIFEIIPNRSVTLIYPAAAHQQNMLVSGLTWVPLWWAPKRVTFDSDRYIYAVASEEPLQLSGETFTSGYFHRVLGLPIYRAERPYTTMRAISRAVVPSVAAEEWAEGVYVLSPTYLTQTYRTVRIHCPGGRVFDVPDDMVARVWCPTRTRVVIVDASRPRSRDYPVGRPVRPDSVFGQGGVRVKLEPRRPRGPIARVVDPTGRDRDDRDDRGRGRDVRRTGRDDRDSDSEKRERERRETEKRGGPVKDLIKDVKKEEQEREKQERERQRREADEARRREAEERKTERDQRKDERKDDRDTRKDERDERKDERKDERDARKDEREERKDQRKEEPKQQGQPRDKRDEKAEVKEEKQEKQEKQDDKKGRGAIKDAIKNLKEKEKEKDNKGKP
jgi:hypothetical protein